MDLTALEEERRIIPAGLADYKESVLADSPDVLWMLDETSGTEVTDSSGNGYHNVYRSGYTLNQLGLIDGYNCTEWLAGSARPASNMPIFNCTDMTLAAVVRITDLSANRIIFHNGHVILSNNQGWFVTVMPAGELRLQCFVGTWVYAQTAPAVIAVNNTYHLAVTYTKSTGVVSFHVNGSVIATIFNTIGSLGLPSTNYYASIASYYGATGYELPGKISGMVYWKDIVLTQAQIQAHFNSTGI